MEIAKGVACKTDKGNNRELLFHESGLDRRRKIWTKPAIQCEGEDEVSDELLLLREGSEDDDSDSGGESRGRSSIGASSTGLEGEVGTSTDVVTIKSGGVLSAVDTRTGAMRGATIN
ncbi:hypothetical protein BU15DRAFT_68290 [Melanogaster broomeanus]|nr:hypothetical protein BU15DRAFT_68290 [Melanogaster broomeanus]